ncbi:hypothetical protein [Ferrimonas sp. YFM]|uniref:hypothetical protein n=1 Tax=Ferrimonas sp. YFM TaxID=3028878 RepID=UPI0025732EA4|nr:hypothetical protein [Ferrimonas sp. YFM]BDY04480.1 hypothetical protein F0521_15210 [Ferrimonas sp. YFM]
MKYLLVVSILLLGGCSSQPFEQQAQDRLLEKVTGKSYSRNAGSCQIIKQECGEGNYTEWVQDNGQLACACN